LLRAFFGRNADPQRRSNQPDEGVSRGNNDAKNDSLPQRESLRRRNIRGFARAGFALVLTSVTQIL